MTEIITLNPRANGGPISEETATLVARMLLRAREKITFTD